MDLLRIQASRVYIARRGPRRLVIPGPPSGGRVRYSEYDGAEPGGRRFSSTTVSGFRRQFVACVNSIEDVQDLNRAAGGHFFAPDTLRFFEGRVSYEVHRGPGGVYFVHSTRCTWADFDPDPRVRPYPRVYRVDGFNPDTGTVESKDPDLGAFTSSARAHTAARAAASSGTIPPGNTTPIGA